jgi:hypothetical protein
VFLFVPWAPISLAHQFHPNLRMSKASTTLPKIPAPLPAKSAWSRGPPQSTTTPSSRSQSPPPSNQLHQTHSRRSSTLGQAVPVKDGFSVSRGNVGVFKQGESYGINSRIPGFNPVFHFRSSSDLWVNRKHFGASIFVDDNHPRCQGRLKVLWNSCCKYSFRSCQYIEVIRIDLGRLFVHDLDDRIVHN